MGKLRAGEIQCPLDSELTNKVFTFHTSTKNFASSVEVMEANQYTLLFAKCEPDLEVSMNVQSVMYNLNPRTHRLDFLSVGKTPLPAIYFSLFLVYLIFGILWVYTIYFSMFFAVILLRRGRRFVVVFAVSCGVQSPHVARGWFLV
nr:protein GPR107-like [Ipomoea batatas]